MTVPDAIDLRLRVECDSLVIVELDARVEEAINAAACRLAEAGRAARIPGVLDVVPAIRSVAFHVDPARTDWPVLVRWFDEQSRQSTGGPVDEPPVIEVPVSYGGVDGPDLESVARAAGVSTEEVIAQHTSAVYRVFMLGFLPGFAYMGVLAAALRLPRLSRPRARVPSGSVAIAGPFTGIYPSDTPGGWHVLGRASVRPFDLAREEPFLFRAGARVRFVAQRGGL